MSDDHEVFLIDGAIEKNDGGNFGHKEADELMEELLEWTPGKGLSFGGAMGVPSEPQFRESPSGER